jgi:orotidine-5'-phosphate decarboxylase
VRAENVEQSPWGSVGAVVGATASAAPRGLDVGGPLLAPGLGAQGAEPADLAVLFDGVLEHVYPVAARQVLQAGPAVGALRQAYASLADACRAVLG